MSNNYKTGIVSMTLIVKQACKLLRRWQVPMFATIDHAVTLGTINLTQANDMKDALLSVQNVCHLFELITGY